KDWRLDAISAEQVSVSGPGGTATLEPKPDTNLVRPTPPVIPSSGPPQPGFSPDASAGSGTPGHPQSGSLPAVTAGPQKPVQPQRSTPVAGAPAQLAPTTLQAQLPPALAGALNSLPPRVPHDDPAPLPASSDFPLPLPVFPSDGAATSMTRHPPHDQ